jgi:hypothetical protein
MVQGVRAAFRLAYSRDAHLSSFIDVSIQLIPLFSQETSTVLLRRQYFVI